MLSNHQHYTARARGFEPRSKVLETSILPLNYARIYLPVQLQSGYKSKSQKVKPFDFFKPGGKDT